MRKNVLFILGLFVVISISAQKVPLKFGKIDEADLAMTVYDKDSSAVAVVLCHYGVFNSTDFSFTETIRIKILKEAGLSFGTYVFSASTDEVQVRGKTFNMENGVLVEEKLKSESIFKERVMAGVYRLRVAMPNVRVGSIVDIESRYQGFPNNWTFQNFIPVRWSEVVLNQSTYVEFSINYFGFEPFTQNMNNRWVCQDLPAFKVEPYLSSYENYIKKMEFDIKRINVPGQYYKEYSTTWEAVNKTMMESDYYGLAISGPCMFLNDIVDQVKASNPTSDKEKMKLAYEALKKIKWNGKNRIMTSSNTLGTPFKEASGNSTDINLMLVKLLRKLDFKAYPVALSTRDNGILSLTSPTMNRFNYSICMVDDGTKRILLDATEKHLPMGMLPFRSLNYQGRLIDLERNEWVDLTPEVKERNFFVYDLNFNDQMQLQGTMINTRYDFSAYQYRVNYDRFNNQSEFLTDVEKYNPGLTILDATIENMDSLYRPVVEKYNILAENKVTQIDDLLLVNAMMFDQVTENPFKLDDRKYPVDFGICKATTYSLRLHIPKGYAVSELPKPMKVITPDEGVSFAIMYSATENEITVIYRFNINKTVFYETNYTYIKELYANLVKKHAEPIVLKKI